MRYSLAFVLLLGALSVQARPTPRPGTASAAAVEARNETAAPSFSRQVRDAKRITAFLADALCLTTSQQLALQHCTVAQRAALLLATSIADEQAARLAYLTAVGRVLVPSQWNDYLALRQQLNGTVMPIDGTDLAIH